MRNTIYLFTALLLMLNQPPALGQIQDAKEAYEFGHAAMQSKDWRDAIEAFETAGKDRQLRAAANYWQAYAHYQVKQRAQARRLLERLIERYPNSEWVDDAQVLLFEHGDGSEPATHQAALDEELKLFTLQQIMFNNPEKALPKVYDLLENSDSERVKHNAIQLLGLSESEAVAEYLFKFINQEKNVDLQHQAIQMLSLRSNANSRKKLQQLYQKSDNRDIKAAIIQGFVHDDNTDELEAMLQQETDPELSIYMIRMLGMQGNAAVLKDRYQQAQGDERRAILEALALAGDASYLYDIIDHESDQEIRNQAIHSLIMVDDDKLGDYLTRLYKKATDESEKDVIASVFVATDVAPEVIVKLLQQESDTERKKQLLQTLMVMDQKDALQQIYEQETDQEIKTSIIRLLGVMDASDVLMEMYKNDPSLAEEAIFYEAFGMSSQALDEDFLMARFKAGNEQVKQGVLNAFMMQGNAAPLVKLLKQESNHEVKKQIIQMISMIDPDLLLDAIED